MDIYTILENWNINTSQEHGYLQELCNKDGAYFMDRFPNPIKNIDKANQLLFSYNDVIENKHLKSEFLKTETRYRNIFSKIWAYSKTFIEYIPNQSSSQTSNIVKSLDLKYKKFSSILKNKKYIDSMTEIKTKEELEFWVQVSLRNDIDITFYFEDYSLLIFSPQLIDVQGFNIFLKNKKHLDFVKNVILSEGMYIW